MSLQLRLTRGKTSATAELANNTTSPRRLSLETLMGGRREVIIQHRGEDYRLRLTSNDKLLLTK